MRMNMTASSPRTSQASVGARHRTFVARVERNRRGVRRVAGPAQILLRTRSRITPLHRSFAVWLHVAVSGLRQVRPHRRGAVTVRRLDRPPPDMRRTRIDQSPAPTRLRRVPFAAAAAILTSRRIGPPDAPARRTRASRDAAPGASVRRPPVPELPFTLATTRATPERPSDRRSDIARGIPHDSARRVAGATIDQSEGLPWAELSRVTEHVLRTLDRRVLAWRERTGQVWESR